MTYLLGFAVAFVIALLLTPVVRALATRGGALDRPDSHRKFHGAPIPKLGGVAVFVAFYVAAWLTTPEGVGASPALAHLAVRSLPPCLLILVLGIADDIWPVRPAAKVVVQLTAGLWVYYVMDLRIQLVSNPFGDQLLIGALGLPATLFWIVLVTNAFNIVDGMDGLAAGVAFIATSCMFVVSLQMDHLALAALAACLAGALLAFLRYNFNPASIFLGDSGSLFLGFLLAVFSIAGQQKSSTAIAIAAPLFMLALPIIEAGTSALRRFLRGQSILQADSDHIHHQLLRRGLSPRRAAILLYVGSAVFGAASLLVSVNGSVIGVTAIVLGAVAWLGIQQLGYSEFVEINNAFKRGFLYQRRIIQNNIITRRLADSLRSSPSLDEAFGLLSEVAERLDFTGLQVRLYGAGGSVDPLVLFDWRRPQTEAAAGDSSCRVLSIQLAGRDGPIGDVTIARPRDTEPLHSELSLLVDTIADRLPPLLEGVRAPVPGQPVKAADVAPVG